MCNKILVVWSIPFWYLDLEHKISRKAMKCLLSQILL